MNLKQFLMKHYTQCTSFYQSQIFFFFKSKENMLMQKNPKKKRGGKGRSQEELC